MTCELSTWRVHFTSLFHAIRKGKLVDACQFGCQISNCNLQLRKVRFSVKRKLATGRTYSDISDIFDICRRRSGKMSLLTAFASSESIIHFLANILAKNSSFSRRLLVFLAGGK